MTDKHDNPGDPICPICRNPIEAGDSVVTSGDTLIHHLLCLFPGKPPEPKTPSA